MSSQTLAVIAATTFTSSQPAIRHLQAAGHARRAGAENKPRDIANAAVESVRGRRIPRHRKEGKS